MKLEKQVQEQINAARKQLSKPETNLSDEKKVEVLDILVEPFKDQEYVEQYNTDMTLQEQFREQLKLVDRKNLLEENDKEKLF